MNVTSTVTLRSVSAAAEPMRSISDGHCARSASASRHHGGVVAIPCGRSPRLTVPELWVLPRGGHKRGFRPRGLSLATEILWRGYQTKNLSRAGIPCAPARTDRAGGDR